LQHQTIELLSLQKRQRRDRGIHRLAVDFHYIKRAGISSPDTQFDLRANRCFLETRLSKHIEQHIRHGHKLKSIKLSTTSGIAIELDYSGVPSDIRAALFPHAKAVVHPYVAIDSKRYISRVIFEQVYAPHIGEYNVLTGTLELGHAGRTVHARLEVAINSYESRKEMFNINNVYSRRGFPDGRLYMPNRPKDAAKDVPEEFSVELESLAKSGKLSPMHADAFSPSHTRGGKLLH
jgi:hypothetical protein